jgi:hypothetical protein
MTKKYDDWIESIIESLVDFNEASISEVVFEEQPVPLDEFLYSDSYLALPPLSPLQYLIVYSGTRIYPPHLIHHLDIDRRPVDLGYDLLLVDEIVAMLGKGSGKGFMSRIMILRNVYLLLCLTSPQREYGSYVTDSIDILNMAYNTYQAKNAFFLPLQRMLDGCPWFEGRYTNHVNQIVFDKAIYAHSGNSSTASFEGFNLLVAVLDEIDAFKPPSHMRVGGVQHDAESLYRAVRSSAVSRFPNVCKVILLSFPRSPDGYIMTKYNEEVNNPHVLAIKAATWEVHPLRSRSDFDREFSKDPIDSAQRYGCEASPSRYTFFRDRTKLYLSFAYNSVLEQVGPHRHNPWHGSGFDRSFVLPVNDRRLRYLHVDIGVNNDSAGIVSVYLHSLVTRGSLELPVIGLDFIATLVPSNTLVGEILLSDIRKIIIDFKKRSKHPSGVPIRLVTFDQFQSRDSMQILARQGIATGRISVDRDASAYTNVKEVAYDRRYVGASSTVMVKELSSLVKLENGKVDHPQKGSKDTADGLAGATTSLLEDLYGDMDRLVYYEAESLTSIPYTDYANLSGSYY